MKGLVVKQPWIDEILSGRKTWELRGSATRIRGKIALIQSGSGTVVGTCEVVDVVGPLSLTELRKTTRRHRVPKELFALGTSYKQTYAWVIRNAKRLREPVSYEHPRGAVIWVNLNQDVARRLRSRGM